jgi:hypothetical protein
VQNDKIEFLMGARAGSKKYLTKVVEKFVYHSRIAIIAFNCKHFQCASILANGSHVVYGIRVRKNEIANRTHNVLLIDTVQELALAMKLNNQHDIMMTLKDIIACNNMEMIKYLIKNIYHPYYLIYLFDTVELTTLLVETDLQLAISVLSSGYILNIDVALYLCSQDVQFNISLDKLLNNLDNVKILAYFSSVRERCLKLECELCPDSIIIAKYIRDL